MSPGAVYAVSGAVSVVAAISVLAARLGCLDIHLRKPTKPRKPPEVNP